LPFIDNPPVGALIPEFIVRCNIIAALHLQGFATDTACAGPPALTLFR
jgi:hypothetical protein